MENMGARMVERSKACQKVLDREGEEAAPGSNLRLAKHFFAFSSVRSIVGRSLGERARKIAIVRN